MIRYVCNMIVWNLGAAMKRAGVENANQLAKRAGLSYPVAWRIIQNAPMERIEVATLEALGRAFGVDPLTLLKHTAK